MTLILKDISNQVIQQSLSFLSLNKIFPNSLEWVNLVWLSFLLRVL